MTGAGRFRACAAIFVVAFALVAAAQSAPLPLASLPPWMPGTFDIHQLSTGRGNAAFFVFPDGTTMLFDAGAAERPEETAGWIADYIAQAMAPVPARLDYAVLSHYHVDHMGALEGLRARIPLQTMLDRGGTYLPPADAGYRRYRAGTQAETIRVGHADQIVPRRDRARYPSFEVRAVAANGEVWTGDGERTTRIFPPLATIAEQDTPSENMCSIALRIRYGRFDFYTGGDLPGIPDAGAPEWHSVETPIARAIGPTDVHVVNHHGSIDPESAYFLSSLRSRVIILPSWSATHPSQDALKRMMTPRLYPGPRDIYATLLHDETRASIGSRAQQLKADHGHIVVRTAPGGDSYRVYVLDETMRTGRPTVLAVHGPYVSE